MKPWWSLPRGTSTLCSPPRMRLCEYLPAHWLCSFPSFFFFLPVLHRVCMCSHTLSSTIVLLFFSSLLAAAHTPWDRRWRPIPSVVFLQFLAACTPWDWGCLSPFLSFFLFLLHARPWDKKGGDPHLVCQPLPTPCNFRSLFYPPLPPSLAVGSEGEEPRSPSLSVPCFALPAPPLGSPRRDDCVLFAHKQVIRTRASKHAHTHSSALGVLLFLLFTSSCVFGCPLHLLRKKKPSQFIGRQWGENTHHEDPKDGRTGGR